MQPKLLTADRFVEPNSGFLYRYVYSDTEYFRPHYHDYYEVFVLLDGTAVHLVNGAREVLHRGSVVFIRPPDTHDYVCENGAPFSMLNLAFNTETADSLFSYLGEGFDSKRLTDAALPPTAQLSESDFKWFTSQMASIRAIDPDNSAARKTALRILLFRLFTKCFSEHVSEETSEMPTWLSRLCEDMRKNGNFTLGTARLYELTDRSREHVARSLKKYTGKTASEFVNDLRLRFVANMLRNSNHSISHIVFEGGFNKISWASELFRKKYGMSMREFRGGTKETKT